MNKTKIKETSYEKEKDKRFSSKTFHGAEFLDSQGTEWKILCSDNEIVVPNSS